MTEIEDKFKLLLREGVNLGAPLASEELLPDGGSRQVFEAGVIYFHPRIGTAFECHGLILQTYLDLGEQRSALGYPVTDELDDPNVLFGRFNEFEGGMLNFDPAVGITPQFSEAIVAQQVVVKFIDSLPINLEQGAEIGLDDLALVLGLFPGHPLTEAVRFIFPYITFRRLFDAMSPKDISIQVEQAMEADPSYEPPSFENFLVIDCPDDFDTESLVDALNVGAGIIEKAYTMPVPSDAGVVVATNNPLFSKQGYLTAIGAQSAWNKGADGGGTRFIDIERGWLLKQHEDLPAGIPLLGGHIQFNSTGHGTAVLGIIAAQDNLLGVVGIAPKADASVMSYFNPAHRVGSTRETTTLASSIKLAANLMSRGDVLLLESQTFVAFQGLPTSVPIGTPTAVPCEFDLAVYEAIREATRLGIIVVVPAGNGGADLDAFRDGANAILSRGGPGARIDSGAIWVGGCTPANARWPDSNVGGRIDCCAWGQEIVTAGNRTAPFLTDGYLKGPAPNFMSGTSGASAIIAGICLLVQNLAGISSRLDGAQMRQILSDPNNGTAVPGVGPIPNLGRIIARHFP